MQGKRIHGSFASVSVQRQVVEEKIHSLRALVSRKAYLGSVPCRRGTAASTVASRAQILWRRQLAGLLNFRLPVPHAKLQAAYNCRPCGFQVLRDARYCFLHACPFCHGRRAANIFAAVLKAAYATQTPITLALRRKDETFSPKQISNSRVGLPGFYEDAMMAQAATTKNFNAIGGAHGVLVQPLAKGYYRVTRASVLAFPGTPDFDPAWGVSKELQIFPGEVEAIAIGNLVVRAFRYPRGLLTCPTSSIRKAIATTFGCRLFQVSGIFRSREARDRSAHV